MEMKKKKPTKQILCSMGTVEQAITEGPKITTNENQSTGMKVQKLILHYTKHKVTSAIRFKITSMLAGIKM